MTRRRWRITILAALATLSAVYPITSLFADSSWFPQAVVVVALSAGVGLVARGLTRSKVLVVVAQVLVVGYVLLFRYAGDTFAWLLPTPTSIEVANSLGLQALDTIQRYTAPAPLNEGVTFWLLVVVAAVAICVDAMAATWRSPAAAGLPLLTAYLITAANGQAALALRFFVVPVVLWLLMLHTTARAGFSRWSTANAAEESEIDEVAHDRDALRSFSMGALKLGALGVVLALVVPLVVPHFPPRYLTEGLGRAEGGGGQGSVGFNDTLDLSRSLNDSDQTPVLSYTTTAFTKSPLRVLATSYYSRGQWLQAGGGNGTGQPQPLPPASQRRDYVIDVTDNTLAAPRIAVPYPVVAVAMQGTPWTIDPITRDVRVGRAVGSYRVTYADVAPSPPQLRDSGRPDSPDVTDDDLRVPDTVRSLVQRWSDEVTAGRRQPARPRDRDPGPPARVRLHLQPRPRRAVARRDRPPDGADPQLLRDPPRLLRAVRHGDDHDGPGPGHPGADGDRLPAGSGRRHRQVHRQGVRRALVAGALLPGLRLAALRAHAGRTGRLSPALCGARRRCRRDRRRSVGHREWGVRDGDQQRNDHDAGGRRSRARRTRACSTGSAPP